MKKIPSQSDKDQRPQMRNGIRLRIKMNQRMTMILAGTLFLTAVIICIIFFFQFSKIENAHATSPSANLDQARNGVDGATTSPVSWVGGNAGNSNAHYIEGMSIPFRCTMTNLTPGTQITLTMGYDIMN